MVDTTTAGDSFIGAFCVELDKGGDLNEAIYFATKFASITVDRRGASCSIPTASEI